MTSDRRRARRTWPTGRGSTLLEALIAMGVLMTGAVGLVGLNNMALRLDSDGRRLTRASAIAQDLASQIALWPYTDARLSNAVTTNDDNIGDTTFALQKPGTANGLVDHGGFDATGRVEPDLTLGGTTWYGIPSDELVNAGFERYWNVSFNDPAKAGALLDYNGNGVADAMRVAVIVRWQAGGGWRRIVVLVTKPNPAEGL